jgi:hypothetical protein
MKKANKMVIISQMTPKELTENVQEGANRESSMEIAYVKSKANKSKNF